MFASSCHSLCPSHLPPPPFPVPFPPLTPPLLCSNRQLSHHFKADSIGDIVERLAVDRNDTGLLMLLTRKTRKELSYKALMVWSVWGELRSGAGMELLEGVEAGVGWFKSARAGWVRVQRTRRSKSGCLAGCSDHTSYPSPCPSLLPTLQFLVHSWSLKLQSAKNKALAKKRPVSAGTTEDKEEDMEVYLVKYARAGRNPLSVVAAILQ